jgi:hypothetical protein
MDSAVGLYQASEASADLLLFGGDTALTGLDSYGEVSPHPATHCAESYNQTMTIANFREGAGA